MTIQQIAIAYIVDGALVIFTRSYDLEMLITEITPSMDESYGVGNWLCCLASELPADFSLDTYTIADGALVPITEKPDVYNEAYGEANWSAIEK